MLAHLTGDVHEFNIIHHMRDLAIDRYDVYSLLLQYIRLSFHGTVFFWTLLIRLIVSCRTIYRF